MNARPDVSDGLRLLRTPEAAALLGIAPSTLAKMRCVSSDGPKFRKIGRTVHYSEESLREFIDRHPARRSTSDASNAG
ncbi:MAG: helix-turn-helix domain-containing protein [Gemmatimonadetes bacterium]|nr:helix-turn-helix domain-containing protein [Gemmatimonadota bacterium]